MEVTHREKTEEEKKVIEEPIIKVISLFSTFFITINPPTKIPVSKAGPSCSSIEIPELIIKPTVIITCHTGAQISPAITPLNIPSLQNATNFHPLA